MSLIGKTELQVNQTLNSFTFSGVEIEKLTGSQYTLVNILVDESASVMDFKNELEKTLATVIDSCKKSPQAETLLARVVGFKHSYSGIEFNEIHGFINLNNIVDGQYINKINPSGCTPLYDATGNALESIESYGKQLNSNDYLVNGIFFVLTDGAENSSSKYNRASDIKDALKRIRRDESLESIRAILIGINDDDPAIKTFLNEFNEDAGFDEYISLGQVSANKLAKLANWISKSVSSQSQSLGSGGPSQPINFAL